MLYHGEYIISFVYLSYLLIVISMKDILKANYDFVLTKYSCCVIHLAMNCLQNQTYFSIMLFFRLWLPLAYFKRCIKNTLSDWLRKTDIKRNIEIYRSFSVSIVCSDIYFVLINRSYFSVLFWQNIIHFFL